MKIAVTPVRRTGTKRWSHLIGETESDLVEASQKLGFFERLKIKCTGNTYEHVDITPEQRRKALKLGATELSGDVQYRK